jgi:hypothetical protein
MVPIVVSLFFGASFITTVALVAAAALSGRVQQSMEAECTFVTAASLHSIAEVELPGYKQRRQKAPVHSGILSAYSTSTPAPRR